MTVVPGAWPSPEEEELGDALSFDEWLGAGRADVFMVEAPADYRELGIWYRDLLIARQGSRVKEGDVIVGQDEEGIKVGKYEEVKRIEGMRLLGRVTAVVRKY